ncbi:hypothetical protein DPEC_G00196430 [Dallia pectoralis]|uniref:Uncharacterized protein n=1 Tax=Dallia pectoralis TaxID=75939 RepID=A0ACC2G844_DALPE|nr:hypothetical protein DPEC_G00196430 [Dallia pectoralis]
MRWNRLRFIPRRCLVETGRFSRSKLKTAGGGDNGAAPQAGDQVHAKGVVKGSVARRRLSSSRGGTDKTRRRDDERVQSGSDGGGGFL